MSSKVESTLTIVSSGAKKKQAVQNELFTGSTALKFVNILDKSPQNLLLSYQGLRFQLYNIIRAQMNT